VIAKLAIAAFLLAHAGIHAAFVAPPPAATAGGPVWPFDLGRSWLLEPLGLGTDTARMVGSALVAATFAGFAVAALAAIGIMPAGLWAPTVTVGAVSSVALIALFFHPWLVLGIAIDVVLVWAVLVAEWAPDSAG
jgi:hypothetical protein